MIKAVGFQRLSQAEVARAHGVDVRTVRRWTSLGLPRNEDGSHSLPATIQWRCANSDRHGIVFAAGDVPYERRLEAKRW